MILTYLTVIWFWGAGIGHLRSDARSAAVVVGIQFVSLGLLSELITSQHEERMDERQQIEQFVEEVLR